MIIAIIGASGAGKSTIINHLKQWKFLKSKRIIVKEEDNFLILKLLKSIFGKKLFNEYKQQKFFNKEPKTLKAKLFSGIVYWFYPAIIYLEFMITHILYSTIWRKRVLISDRYIYDYLVTFEEMLNIHNRAVSFLINKFPKPYLIIYLKVNQQTSLARNKDNIKGKITANRKLHGRVLNRYNELASQLSILIVNSDGNKYTTIREVKEYLYSKEKLTRYKSLAISGVDGSGKTTACENLNKLCLQLSITSKVVHFYHLPILYKLLVRLGFIKPNLEKKASSYGTKSFIWALLTFMDSYIQYIYARITNLGSLIIYDRYFYDYLVSFKYRKVPFVNLFISLIPRVGSSFVLFVKPKMVINRKGESIDLGYLKEIQKLYVNLVKQHEITPIKVGSKNQESVLKELVEAM